MKKSTNNYYRYNYWKAAYGGQAVLLSGAEKPMTGIKILRITLQYPVTGIGWDRVEETLREEFPNIRYLTLLALTPYEPDDAQAS